MQNKISWSSLSLLERSEKEWVDKYIHGIEFAGTKYTEFGLRFHESVGNSDFWHDKVREVRGLVEGEPEHQFLAKVSGVFLHGFCDWYSLNRIYEIKTGGAWWTQKRVDEHGQLDFYALAMEMRGTPVKEFTMISVRTDFEREGCLADKPIRVLHRTITDLQPIWERIRKYKERADELYNIYK